MALQQVVCPACETGNRIGDGAPAAARCGKCGEPLFKGEAIEVDDRSFVKHLKLTKGLIVLDVWAPWCGPCRMMAPHFAEAAGRLSGDAVFLKMNADACETPGKLGVRGIPTLFLFENGEAIGNKPGFLTSEALADWIGNVRSAA